MTSGSSNSAAVFTIGHSNLELADFLEALVAHRIRTLCDVRSRPGSFRHPQFNREPLEAGLRSANMQYVFLGDSLGGRPADPHVYRDGGVVDYVARRKAADFSVGIDRALEYLQTGNVVLMCAEEDPLQCHRFLMICPALIERAITPLHIRKGAALESQREAEDRLLALHGLTAFDSGSLFAFERSGALEDAIRLQSKDYAFRASPEALESF